MAAVPTTPTFVSTSPTATNKENKDEALASTASTGVVGSSIILEGEFAFAPSSPPILACDAFVWYYSSPDDEPIRVTSSRTVDQLLATIGHATDVPIIPTAAASVNTRLLVNVGYAYQHALYGTPKNEIKAVELYRRAGELNDALGCYNLACMMRDGAGVERNQDEAVRWWLAASILTSSPSSSPGVALSSMPQLSAYKNLSMPVKGGMRMSIRFGSVLQAHAERIFQLYATAVGPPPHERWANGTIDSTLASYFYIMGRCYSDGFGVAVDQAKALAIWRYGSQLKHSDGNCEHAIGYSHHVADGCSHDEDMAFVWYLKAAHRGSARSMQTCAERYKKGSGVKQDLELAFYWMERAADSGYPAAQKDMGRYLIEGIGCQPNPTRALEYWQAAIARDNVATMLALADSYRSINVKSTLVPKNDTTAYELFTRAAALGSTWALYRLGTLHRDGHGCVQSNERAMEYWLKASRAGHRDVNNGLAVAYLEGRMVPQDHQKAIEFWKLGADAGDSAAQYNLAIRFAHGRQIPRDDAQAFKYMEMSAKLRDSDAQFDVGRFHEFGRGCKRNPVAAIEWWTLSARQNNEDAIETLKCSLRSCTCKEPLLSHLPLSVPNPAHVMQHARDVITNKDVQTRIKAAITHVTGGIRASTPTTTTYLVYQHGITHEIIICDQHGAPLHALPVDTILRDYRPILSMRYISAAEAAHMTTLDAHPNVIASYQLTDCTLGDGRVLSLMPYYALTLHDFIRHRRRIARLLTRELPIVTNDVAEDPEAMAVTPAATAVATATTTEVASPEPSTPSSSASTTAKSDDTISCPLTYGEVRWVGHQICAALDHLQDNSIAHNNCTIDHIVLLPTIISEVVNAAPLPIGILDVVLVYLNDELSLIGRVPSVLDPPDASVVPTSSSSSSPSPSPSSSSQAAVNRPATGVILTNFSGAVTYDEPLSAQPSAAIDTAALARVILHMLYPAVAAITTNAPITATSSASSPPSSSDTHMDSKRTAVKKNDTVTSTLMIAPPPLSPADELWDAIPADLPLSWRALLAGLLFPMEYHRFNGPTHRRLRLIMDHMYPRSVHSPPRVTYGWTAAIAHKAFAYTMALPTRCWSCDHVHFTGRSDDDRNDEHTQYEDNPVVEAQDVTPQQQQHPPSSSDSDGDHGDHDDSDHDHDHDDDGNDDDDDDNDDAIAPV